MKDIIQYVMDESNLQLFGGKMSKVLAGQQEDQSSITNGISHISKSTRSRNKKQSWIEKSKNIIVHYKIVIIITLIFICILFLVDISYQKTVFKQQLRTQQLQNQVAEYQSQIKKIQKEKATLKAQLAKRKFNYIKDEASIDKKEPALIQKEKTKQQKKVQQKMLPKISQLKYDISKIQNPNQVVDVAYDSGEFAKMPLNTRQLNKDNKNIEEVLYPDQAMRNKRTAFIEERKKFLATKTAFPQLGLIEHNNPTDEAAYKRGIQENQKDWLRLQTKFKFSQFKEELPMCIIVPGYNNNANFRIEHNLNSIFMQNYTNYRAVIIDDFSTDGSIEVYKKYFAFYRIDKSFYTLVSNTKKATAMTNHYFGTLLQCRKDSIVLNLDGDDELIGRNVLNLFNWGYRTKKSGVIYSNFYWYQQPSTLMYGFTSEYSDNEKKNNLYRTTGMKYSHLRTFRAELIHQIDPKDFQDSSGNFFNIAADIALIIPLMELSCGRVNKIQGEFSYLYTMGTGINDYNDRGRQVAVQNQIRRQKTKYECWKQFEERMKQ